jgi:hypothetical protein
MDDFIKNIEDIWLPNSGSDGCDDQSLMKRYESLKEHFDLIKKIIGYYSSKNGVLHFNHEQLLNHLQSRFRAVFAMHGEDHPVDSNSDAFAINTKNHLLLLFAWTSLLMESFQADAKSSPYFKLNSINLLQTINVGFSPRRRSTHVLVNYLHFLQNDRHLCIEYLLLLNSFEVLSFNLETTAEGGRPENPMAKINKFVESVISDTCLILVNTVAFKQHLFQRKEQPLQSADVIINNLVNIIPFLQNCFNKSSQLFEQGLKYVITILTANNTADETRELNVCTAELFKCFEIQRATLLIKNFLYVI